LKRWVDVRPAKKIKSNATRKAQNLKKAVKKIRIRRQQMSPPIRKTTVEVATLKKDWTDVFSFGGAKSAFVLKLTFHLFIIK
jgi:hypothetical protein